MKSRALLLLASLTSCADPPPAGPVVASVIGDRLRLVDPSQRPIDAAAATLLSATAQGLVRLDAAGQVEPGLAIRWDVSDDGLYYTFRIAEGLPIDAEGAARRLTAAIGPTSRNPLKSVLAGIAEIVAVTPQVIEIRLSVPNADLLALLARPELALIGDGGSGPFRITERDGPTVLLVPVAEEGEADALDRVALRAERPALAVARFLAGDATLVLGGDFASLPVATAASPPERALVRDPAVGLFGLAFVARDGFTAAPEHRRALAMAIDRAALAAAIGHSVPAQADLGVGPGAPIPDWSGLPLATRRAEAGATVAASATTPRLRIALPPGPGAERLFHRIAADWRAIGVDAVAVGPRAPADVRLLDRLAPGEGRAWYLRSFACATGLACSGIADGALAAGDPLAADTLLAAAHIFVSFGAPIRWSLVTPDLRGFQPNRAAAHPLDQLRAPAR